MPFAIAWGNIHEMGFIKDQLEKFDEEVLVIKQTPRTFILVVLAVCVVVWVFVLIPANKFYYEGTINSLTAANKTLTDEKENPETEANNKAAPNNCNDNLQQQLNSKINENFNLRNQMLDLEVKNDWLCSRIKSPSKISKNSPRSNSTSSTQKTAPCLTGLANMILTGNGKAPGFVAGDDFCVTTENVRMKDVPIGIETGNNSSVTTTNTDITAPHGIKTGDNSPVVTNGGSIQNVTR